MAIVAPSILAADFAHLASELDACKKAGAPWIHVDVMDGHFVPNISFGIPVIRSIRKATDLTLDVHLMITEPIRFVEDVADAGADRITIHYEADTPERIAETIRKIRELGVRPGISIKPGTPAEALEPYLHDVDLILIMTVEPGFGGQAFMEDMMEKLRYLRARLDQCNPDCVLEVDGGVNFRTAAICKAAGAEVLVSGSSFFGAENQAAYVAELSK